METILGIPIEVIVKFRERLNEQNLDFILADYKQLYLENIELKKDNLIFAVKIDALEKELKK